MASNKSAARIILDSVSPSGVRLTTFELVFPRCVLGEFNTHRAFSRNSASSRAIPVSKIILDVIDSPYVPEFRKSKAGMQGGDLLSGQNHKEATESYLAARDAAVVSALRLVLGSERVELMFGQVERNKFGNVDVVAHREYIAVYLREYDRLLKEQALGDSDLPYLSLHKQVVNRILEPFMWQTVLVTATEWSNFWALRDHADADPAIARVAHLAQEAYKSSTPSRLEYGQWHLPLILEDEKAAALADPKLWCRISAGRCARVSYKTHHGTRDIDADVMLFDRLYEGGHMSPLEHIATPCEVEKHTSQEQWSGNFRGWKQWRKFFQYEDDFSKRS